MHKATGIVRISLLAALLLALTACTASFRNHGYAPSEAQLSEIALGKDTKTSVAEAIGQPTTAGVLDGSAWYYVQSRFRHYAYQEPREVERQVVAISFTAAGLVSNIERFGLENGQVVTLSRRVTASSVRDTTFLRQLLGNIGQINAGQLLGR